MSFRKTATTGFIWTFGQQFGGQIIGFIVSLVLARILLPKEFGLIGMISIFVAIGNTLLNAGLTQSIIRTPDEDLTQTDYSTVFYFNLVASLLFYVLIYLTAPLVADFYDQQVLIQILRIYCLTFIINSFSAVQLARLTKKMDFKTQTIVALPSLIISGIFGIFLAYKGYGVWSLVYSYLLKEVLNAIQLWFHSKWNPKLTFSWNKFKVHFIFGYRLTLSGLLNTIFNNIYTIVIGKYFSAGQVGFYTRALTTRQLPVNNISTALNKVTYPLFSSIQDDDERLKRAYEILMKMVMFVIAPLLIFLAVLATPAFRFLFTSKWLPAVPYFQILCVGGVLYPLNAYNLNILKVKGRSDLILKLEFIKKVLIGLTILITIKFGIYGLLYGQAVLAIISFFINSYYSGKFINYTAWDQVKNILPILIFAILSGLGIYSLDRYLLQDFMDILRLLIGGLLGTSLYLIFTFFFDYKIILQFKKILFTK